MARSGEPDWSSIQGAHIVDDPLDERTRCGIRVKDRAALPYLGAAHVPVYEANARAYGVILRFCPDCQARS